MLIKSIPTTPSLMAPGAFVVERFIATGVNPGEHAKSWQFLSVPLNTTQTVKEAWQEGNSNAECESVPGFGTQITSNLAGATTPALGFDVFTAPGPSMKTYNHVTHGWDGISSIIILPITNQKGYMIFVRRQKHNCFQSACECNHTQGKG